MDSADEMLSYRDQQAYRLIEQVALWEGRVTTNNLQDAFGCSRATASPIIQGYLDACPENLTYCAKSRGYLPTEQFTAQYTNDGGVDGIINEDPLGLDTIYLQAKRYTDNSIGRPDIQAFVGALEMKRARKGVFITTSRFSRDAIEYVNMIEKRVVLIDGAELAALMIKHDLGVATKEVYKIKDIDTDYFNED